MVLPVDQAFPPASTVVRRDIYRGKIWSAWPCRALSDTADLLTLAFWPGVTGLAPVTFIASMRSGNAAADRARSVEALASGRWELGSWVWRDTTRLVFVFADAYFSISLFLRDPGQPWTWYVDFGRPPLRTAIGYDTLDLLLDLVITPDGSYRWKDEDEYEQGRRLGIITDNDHKEVSTARERVVAMFERREAPFSDRWPAWRPEPDWPAPSLPADALTCSTDETATRGVAFEPLTNGERIDALRSGHETTPIPNPSTARLKVTHG